MAHLNGELFHWQKLKREEVDCPLCQSPRYALYERYGEAYQYSYVRCRDCTFIYQNPRFEYNDDFLRWAYSWYGEEFIKNTGEEGYPSQKDNRYFAFKKSLIDRFSFAKPYRLLDIGAACGQFLAHCHDGETCIATGLETSATQVAYARRHLPFDYLEGTTADIQDRVNVFDVVHIAHTLEHVPDPKQVVKEILQVTKPGGLVFIEVPNVRSLKNYSDHLRAKAGVRKNTWRPGDFPEHLVEFTPSTLKKFVKTMGLELLYFQCHSKSGLDKRPHLQPADFFINKIVPIGNNLIAIGRKFFP